MPRKDCFSLALSPVDPLFRAEDKKIGRNHIPCAEESRTFPCFVLDIVDGKYQIPASFQPSGDLGFGYLAEGKIFLKRGHASAPHDDQPSLERRANISSLLPGHNDSTSA